MPSCTAPTRSPSTTVSHNLLHPCGRLLPWQWGGSGCVACAVQACGVVKLGACGHEAAQDGRAHVQWHGRVLQAPSAPSLILLGLARRQAGTQRVTPGGRWSCRPLCPCVPPCPRTDTTLWSLACMHAARVHGQLHGRPGSRNLNPDPYPYPPLPLPLPLTTINDPCRHVAREHGRLHGRPGAAGLCGRTGGGLLPGAGSACGGQLQQGEVLQAPQQRGEGVVAGMHGGGRGRPPFDTVCPTPILGSFRLSRHTFSCLVLLFA